MSQLDGIETHPPEIREALLIQAVRNLERKVDGLMKALLVNAGTILVGIIVYLVTSRLA